MFKKKDETPQLIKRMRGHDYIDSTRDYLDYLEEHLNNVAKAFNELSKACAGKECWVSDDFEWRTFKNEVEKHDLSKFGKNEFVQYRDNFFPVCEEDKKVVVSMRLGKTIKIKTTIIMKLQTIPWILSTW